MNSLQKIIEHYHKLHKINVENSPTFERYIGVIDGQPSKFFMEQREYCNGSLFTDPTVKARHYLARHLNLDNLFIRRYGSKFIKFSIGFNRFGIIYDFKDPRKV